MTTDTAKAFHLKVLEDESIQKALLDEAYETGQEPDWTAHARKYGLEVSAEEAESYLTGLESEEYELTEFELELVAAASTISCGEDGL